MTACADGRARVWDAATGAALTPPLAQTEALRWAGFSRDGRLVVTRTVKGTVQLWRADTGAPAGGPWIGVPPQNARDGGIRALTFSADGRWLAIPGKTAIILQPLAGDDAEPRTLPTPFPVNQALFSPDDTQLAILMEGGRIELRDLAGERVVALDLAPRGWRNGAWSPDGTRFAAADDHFTAHIFDTASGRPITVNLAHTAIVAGCRFSPDGRTLITWSIDNAARLFDAADGHPLTLPLRHRGPIYAAALGSDGGRLATASADGVVRFWNANTGEALGGRLPHGGPVYDVNFSEDGEQVATASEDGFARVWKIPSDGFAHWARSYGSPVDCAIFSPDGKRVAVSCLQDWVTILDVASGARLGEALRHPGKGVKVDWLDDRRLVTSCVDGQFRIWDAATGAMLSTAPMPGTVNGYFFGRHFLARFSDRAPEVWDTLTNQRRCVLPVAPKGFASLRADGRQALVGSGREWRVFDTETGALAHPAITLSRSAQFGALSADGRRIAMGFPDFSIAVLDAVTGAPIAGSMRHTAALCSLTFTPDGRILVSTSTDQTFRLWDASTGEPLCPPQTQLGYVLRASARADGRAFVTATNGGWASLWEVPPAPESISEMARIAHRLSGGGE